MKLLKLPLLVLVYFSIATVVAQLALLGVLVARKNLDTERLFQLMAVANDVDLYATWKKLETTRRPIQRAQVSYLEVVDTRRSITLDFDLREMAVDKGQNDMQQLATAISKERERYLLLRNDFEQRLEDLRQGAVDQAVLNVQRQLEAVSPRLAKDQIVRILDDETLDPEAALRFVVTIVKAMSLEKRKKIMAEFKNQDAERLHDILSQIRLGVPDVQLVRETRSELKKFMSRN